MVRTLLVIGVLGVSTLVPSPASAITVDEVVDLAKSGVTDTVILALIDRDRTVFAIEPEQIVSLRRDGLSEQVILAMLKSGRDEGEQAARADSASNAGWIAATLATEPQSISVGHGPDRIRRTSMVSIPARRPLDSTRRCPGSGAPHAFIAIGVACNRRPPGSNPSPCRRSLRRR